MNRYVHTRRDTKLLIKCAVKMGDELSISTITSRIHSRVENPIARVKRFKVAIPALAIRISNSCRYLVSGYVSPIHLHVRPSSASTIDQSINISFQVREALLVRHRHQHERRKDNNMSKLPIIRSLAEIGRNHSSSKSKSRTVFGRITHLSVSVNYFSTGLSRRVSTVTHSWPVYIILLTSIRYLDAQK